MIKIHDKIWYVVKPDHEDKLAYMSPYSETLEGNPDSKTASMQSTGRGWANGRYHFEKESKESFEGVLDNSPQTGFYVGSSVSRWSTSNKLFRVKDPRGFTVEIPTDNLATLLHHTTVVKGVVQEECVWGREGNSHILLPVNSQPYLDTLEKMDVLENGLIPIKDLKIGDVVKFFDNDKEYHYLGKIKATWELSIYEYVNDYANRSYSTYYHPQKKIELGVKIVTDEKWVDAFVYDFYSGNKYIHTTAKPKIVSVERNEEPDYEPTKLTFWVPERVSNKVEVKHYEQKLVAIEVKGNK